MLVPTWWKKDVDEFWRENMPVQHLCLKPKGWFNLGQRCWVEEVGENGGEE